MTTYPHLHMRRPHVNLWPVAVVVFAAAFVGLGSWVLVDRYAGGGGATQDATALIDNFNAALGAGDANALAALMATNVEGRSLGDIATGSKTIGNAQASVASGVRVERVAPVTVEGQFAMTIQRYTAPGETGTMLSVYQLRDGKILRFWNYRPSVDPPFENAIISSS